MRLLNIICTLVLLIASNHSVANEVNYFVSGGDLSEYAVEYDKDVRDSEYVLWKSMLYQGFVSGVHDSLTISLIICPDEYISKKQIFAIVSKFVQNHPEYWDLAAQQLVEHTLKSQFECE